MKSEPDPGRADVDRYLLAVPGPFRGALRKLRRTIRAAAPAASERLSYKMPSFFLNGPLVYYAAFEDHCSLFLGSVRVLERFGPQLKPYRSAKGTLRFEPDRPIPASLLTRLVKARVAENAARARARASGAGTHRARAKVRG